MTKLNYTLAIDNNCNLTLSDTTGFYDAVTNPTGFLTEADASAATFGVYKLSQGYFINVLLYNKYNQSPIIANAAESFRSCPLPISTTYASNFGSMTYNLTADGTYTMKRFFMISSTYYATVQSTGIFNGHDVYYTDGTTIMYVANGVPTPMTVAVFLSSVLTNATVVELDTSFISTCQINACYFKLMNILLDANMNSCPTDAYNKLTQGKDLLYMTLEAVKYLQEQNAITQIQKLIESASGCCSICNQPLPILTSNYQTSGYPQGGWAGTGAPGYTAPYSNTTSGGCGCG